MLKIQTLNQISDKGLVRFPKQDYQVGQDIKNADAILVRSQKLSMENINSNLKAVARAGAGVNNIPVDSYTKEGIVVFNTPGANANAVKELVLCGLLLSSRGILQGINWVNSLSPEMDGAEMSKLIESQKKNFKGMELKGKTLGIIGLGAIGAMVADAAIQMGMKVLGYDPAISVNAAWRLANQIEKQENLTSLISRSDFVTLHLPVLESTRNLIDRKVINYFKSGAVLLNFSRDAIVDEGALLEALNNGRLSNYVTDFPSQELLKSKKAILLPHIGASTDEAEENCAIMAVDQLRNFLENGTIENSVNFPSLALEKTDSFRIAIINQNVPRMLGQILSILADKDINVLDMLNKSRNDVAYNLIDIETKPSEDTLDEIRAIEDVIKVWLI
ncbi:MAG: phosphoglycerate dehydrogenase [Gammaproteobacteria bacterium]|jgi:D-3-phosphoglycerate dehydrogenase|nr:phosphoglycerate dehydrogenase [Gammaproteobacteria bacterium]MBT6043013.1 phosphoglycerate dehydrogenase [Gammaproteobacteria bacterium]